MNVLSPSTFREGLQHGVQRPSAYFWYLLQVCWGPLLEGSDSNLVIRISYLVEPESFFHCIGHTCLGRTKTWPSSLFTASDFAGSSLLIWWLSKNSWQECRMTTFNLSFLLLRSFMCHQLVCCRGTPNVFVTLKYFFIFLRPLLLVHMRWSVAIAFSFLYTCSLLFSQPPLEIICHWWSICPSGLP